MREHIQSREAALKARRMGGIRCMGETLQKKMERLTSEAGMRRNVFMGNNSCIIQKVARSLASLVSLYRTVFPRPFVAKIKEEKTPNNTSHNPDFQSRLAYAFAPSAALTESGDFGGGPCWVLKDLRMSKTVGHAQ
jgi:hypothetical protein